MTNADNEDFTPEPNKYTETGDRLMDVVNRRKRAIEHHIPDTQDISDISPDWAVKHLVDILTKVKTSDPKTAVSVITLIKDYTGGFDKNTRKISIEPPETEDLGRLTEEELREWIRLKEKVLIGQPAPEQARLVAADVVEGEVLDE